jgi:hypothetical protein
MAGYCFKKPNGAVVEIWQDHKSVQSLLDGEGNLILKDRTKAVRDRDEEANRGYEREKAELEEDKAKAKAKAKTRAPVAEPEAPADEAPPIVEDEPEKQDVFPEEELRKIEKEELAPVAEALEEDEKSEDA